MPMKNRVTLCHTQREKSETKKTLALVVKKKKKICDVSGNLTLVETSRVIVRRELA